MVAKRGTQFASRLLGLVFATVTGLVMVSAMRWLQKLSPVWLFVVTFTIISVVWYGTEWWYKREYGREYVSSSHLNQLKKTAHDVAKCVGEMKNVDAVDVKDRHALFAHVDLIGKSCEKWDNAVSAWNQARWVYEKKLATMFQESDFVEPRFNRTELLMTIQAVTRIREMSVQKGLQDRLQMQWVWDLSPMTVEGSEIQDLLIRSRNGILFIRDIHNHDQPIDVEECKRKLMHLFDTADSCPELVDWVRRELVLEDSEWVAILKESLDDVVRLDQLRRGRGCRQCDYRAPRLRSR